MLNLILKYQLILIIFNSIIISQVSQQWAARYNGSMNNSDYANDIAISVAGDIYVTGASYGANNDLNYMTIKYNSAGAQLWTRTYDGLQGEDVAEAIAVDFLGNVYVTGRISVSGSGFNFYTIKMNSAGTVQWGANYNGPGNNNDKPHSIAVDGTGNVYVGGESTGNGTGLDYCLVKYNSSGIQQWVYRYNGTINGNDILQDIKIDNAGNNIYLTGHCEYGSPVYADFVTIRVNSFGTQQWAKRYDGSSSQGEAKAITIDGSGNVYVTGWELVGWEDYVTVKYNSSGTQLWAAVYNGTGNRTDKASDIEVDGNGNVYVTGNSAGTNLQPDYCTIKYNSAGNQVWVNRWTGTGANHYSYASSLKLDAGSNVYVTGYSGASIFTYDYCTLRYSSAGAQQWWVKYNGTGSGNDLATSLAVDGSGIVYISGSSYGSNADFATIKYGQTVGVEPINNEIPENYELSQNYPNPFNPSTTIEFALPKAEMVKLSIYDILGNVVSVLLEERKQAGVYSLTFDASKYSTGIYFYNIETDDFRETKKMMLVK